MRLDDSQDAGLLGWAESRLGMKFSPATCFWLGGVESVPVFVVVYSHFSSANCMLTIATDGTARWATRRSLRRIFALPFEVWGLRRVTFIVDESNDKSLRMMRKGSRSPLGVVEEGRMRCAFDERAGVVFGMLREECRWL